MKWIMGEKVFYFKFHPVCPREAKCLISETCWPCIISLQRHQDEVGLQPLSLPGSSGFADGNADREATLTPQRPSKWMHLLLVTVDVQQGGRDVISL